MNYNHLEIRKELTNKSLRFANDSDTDISSADIEEYGTNLLSKF